MVGPPSDEQLLFAITSDEPLVPDIVSFFSPSTKDCGSLMISAPLAIEFIAYALMMAGLGVIGGLYTPVTPLAMLIVGIAGACFGLLWAILIFRRIRCRPWAISTMAGLSIAGIWLAANAWMVPGSNESEGRVPVILAGLMTFFSVGQLILLMQDKSQ